MANLFDQCESYYEHIVWGTLVEGMLQAISKRLGFNVG